MGSMGSMSGMGRDGMDRHGWVMEYGWVIMD